MKSLVSVDEEYERNPAIKRTDVLELIEWMKSEQPHLPPLPEFEMIQALNAGDYDKKKTKESIILFYALRNSYKEFYCNLDIMSDEIVKAFNTITLVVLPATTPKGYRVGFFKYHDINPANFDCMACMKLLIMVFACSMFDYGTCPGYILFMDFEGSCFRHVLALKLRCVRYTLKIMQESVGVKIKELEHYNFPIDGPLKIMQPFIGSDFSKKFKFRKNLEEVYENIPQEMFPSDYPGGKAPSIKELREYWWNRLLARRFEMLEMENLYLIDESKRPPVKHPKSWYNIF